MTPFRRLISEADQTKINPPEGGFFVAKKGV